MSPTTPLVGEHPHAVAGEPGHHVVGLLDVGVEVLLERVVVDRVDRDVGRPWRRLRRRSPRCRPRRSSCCRTSPADPTRAAGGRRGSGARQRRRCRLSRVRPRIRPAPSGRPGPSDEARAGSVGPTELCGKSDGAGERRVAFPVTVMSPSSQRARTPRTQRTVHFRPNRAPWSSRNHRIRTESHDACRGRWLKYVDFQAGIADHDVVEAGASRACQWDGPVVEPVGPRVGMLARRRRELIVVHVLRHGSARVSDLTEAARCERHDDPARSRGARPGRRRSTRSTAERRSPPMPPRPPSSRGSSSSPRPRSTRRRRSPRRLRRSSGRGRDRPHRRHDDVAPRRGVDGSTT